MEKFGDRRVVSRVQCLMVSEYGRVPHAARCATHTVRMGVFVPNTDALAAAMGPATSERSQPQRNCLRNSENDYCNDKSAPGSADCGPPGGVGCPRSTSIAHPTLNGVPSQHRDDELWMVMPNAASRVRVGASGSRRSSTHDPPAHRPGDGTRSSGRPSGRIHTTPPFGSRLTANPPSCTAR